MLAASAAVLALNPARVAEWWLVGYESRQLDRTEFDNDNIDAGDVGAGQSVTVLYELVLAGTNITVAEGSFPEKTGRMSLVSHPFDPRSGYRPRLSAAAKFANLSVHPIRNCIACTSPALWERLGQGARRNWAGRRVCPPADPLRIRYKPAGSEASRLIEVPVDASREASDLARVSEATRFAVAIAWIGQILKRETAINESGYSKAPYLARAAVGADPAGDRIEFLAFAHKEAAHVEALFNPHPGDSASACTS